MPETITPRDQKDLMPYVSSDIKKMGVESINYSEIKGSIRTSDICCWTDGSCIGNPGPCGAGTVVSFNTKRYQVFQALGKGTNNIGELTSVILAFKIVRQGLI